MKKLWEIISSNILLLTLLLLLYNCKGTSGDEDKHSNQKAETILKIHGSNTIGAELMPKLVTKWLESHKATNIKIIKGETIEEKSIQATIGKRRVAVEIHSYGSSTGFDDLFWKRCDLAMSSKPVPDAEVTKLKKLGNMRSSQCENVIALDGIAIIVNKDNPLDHIDIETVRRIFNGSISNWNQVDPKASGKINIYRRDNNSGTQEVFSKLVMKKENIVQRASISVDNRELSDNVQGDLLGIGYTSVTFTGDNKVLKIRGEGDRLFEASNFTVQTEDYPLSRRLYLYTPEKANKRVEEFLEFVLSHGGQKEVEQVGFVAQTPKLLKPTLASNTPSMYRKEVQNALRLSMNFRFLPGTSTLDTRSQRDVKRLVKFIKDEKLETCDLKLLGFSDNVGNKKNNYRLSFLRANSVAKIIEKSAGIPIDKVKGFGPIMPVADNATLSGREKNRRVEVWISCGS